MSVPPLLANVAAPTVAPQGTTGSTAYSYVVVGVVSKDAKLNENESLAPTATATATGNATLDASNFNRISWSDVSGYASYRIYRTASAGSPSSTGLIGEVVAGVATFDDIGLAADGTSPSSENTTGDIILDLTSMNSDHLSLSLENVGTATYRLYGSYGGKWVTEGAAKTADAIFEVTATKFIKLRMRCTAYTSGAPKVYVVGEIN